MTSYSEDQIKKNMNNLKEIIKNIESMDLSVLDKLDLHMTINGGLTTDELRKSIEFHNFTNDSFYLDNAKIAADYIIDNYFHKYFLLDEPISKKSLSSFLGKSNPFSGGYIELFLELYSICKDQKYLNISAKKLNDKKQLKFFRKYIQNNSTIPNNYDDLEVAIITPDKDIIPDAETLNPAYVVFNNYEIILQWNRSLRFALAVCTLKDKFKNEI